MNGRTIRPAYSEWPTFNRRLRDVVAALTAEQLAIQPGPDRWPLWATVGHLACQRVFWLCDYAGEPGADTTRFTNAGYDCPGDDDLEHVLSPADLTEALDATFRIVEGCLDRWTYDMLEIEIRREAVRARSGAYARLGRSSEPSPTTSITAPSSTRRSVPRDSRRSTPGVEGSRYPGALATLA